MSVEIIEEVDPRRCIELLEEIARLEKKIFPKHESLARSLKKEMKRKNSSLIYVEAASGEQGGEGELVGYVMYSWISSLGASITKLAVKERYRRQGHGEALLRATIQKCRTKKAHRLATRKTVHFIRRGRGRRHSSEDARVHFITSEPEAKTDMAGDDGGADEELQLNRTPTWIVSIVFTFIQFKRKNQKTLFQALQKMKEELMLMGFISLLLVVFQGAIQKICIPESYTATCGPVRVKTSPASTELPTSAPSSSQGLFSMDAGFSPVEIPAPPTAHKSVCF